jgi:hypothetical protein
MPSPTRKRRIRFYQDSSRSRGSDRLSQNEPAGVAAIAAWPPSKILGLTSADRRLANVRCGRIVTLLESYMRRLEGLRKRYYPSVVRHFFSRRSLLGALATGATGSSPMTTWTTIRSACGAICLVGSLTMGETAKASPARLPWGLLQICRDCQNSCVPLTCAFFFWHSWADKMRCTCFIWRCFQRQFYRWTPNLRS